LECGILIDSWDLVIVEADGKAYSIDLASIDSKLYSEILKFVALNKTKHGEYIYESVSLNKNFIP
jgi:hypothetical protein